MRAFVADKLHRNLIISSVLGDRDASGSEINTGDCTGGIPGIRLGVFLAACSRGKGIVRV